MKQEKSSTEEVERLAEKYGISVKKIEYILSNFGTIENAYMRFVNLRMYDNDTKLDSKTISILRSLRKDCTIDIDGNSHKNLEEIYLKHYRYHPSGLKLYSSEGIKKDIREAIGETPEESIFVGRSSKVTTRTIKMREALKELYGLNEEGKCKDSDEVAAKLNLNHQQITEVKNIASKLIGRKYKIINNRKANMVPAYTYEVSHESSSDFGIDMALNHPFATSEEKEQMKHLIMNIELQNTDNLNEDLKSFKMIQEKLKIREEKIKTSQWLTDEEKRAVEQALIKYNEPFRIKNDDPEYGNFADILLYLKSIKEKTEKMERDYSEREAYKGLSNEELINAILEKQRKINEQEKEIANLRHEKSKDN